MRGSRTFCERGWRCVSKALHSDANAGVSYMLLLLLRCPGSLISVLVPADDVVTDTECQ